MTLEGAATAVGAALGLGLALALDKYVGTPLERRLHRFLYSFYKPRGQ